MTNREAIRLIRNLPTMCEFTDAYGEPIDSDAYYEAVDMAISALQAQDSPKPTAESVQNVPKEDLISRKAVIDYCYALINAENPSDPSDEWNYSQERINQTEVILHHLEFMPSAQPERKKGKWQITDAYPHNVYCSECHTRFAQTHWAVWEDGSLPRNFCPNCGADMREETDAV